jgi:saccharopine dehydrogenase-like NADP-dependent oxidoreductase
MYSDHSNTQTGKILILGAGRSCTYLIEYLAEQAPTYGWQITVGDADFEQAQRKSAPYPHVHPILFDIFDQKEREKQISRTDVVISMLPAVYHIYVARTCLRFRKHLFTASYISPEIKELHKESLQEDVLILMEMGLDPGIDHMSSKQIIDQLHAKGGVIRSFKSFCGGLIAPESDDNPWGYKFTWNPRNVVMAGQSTVKYLENGHYKYIPAHQVFNRTEEVHVEGCVPMEAYGNRDSLGYQDVYGLKEAHTLLRGTIRKIGFCHSWQLFVKLGMTTESYTLENSENMTYRDFVETYLPESSHPDKTIEQRFAEYLRIDEHSDDMEKMRWLGIFSDEKITLAKATPAQILQEILEKKWVLKDGDKDMIVMQHRFDYELNGELRHRISSLVIKGEDALHTAMAKAVGLPLAVAAKLLLQGKLTPRGVQIPIWQEIYEPVLEELKKLGIEFTEQDMDKTGRVLV